MNINTLALLEIIFGPILILLGLIGLVDVFSPLFWKKVKGKILYSDISSHEYYDPESGLETLHSLEMEYEYSYNKHIYTSDQISRSLFGIGHKTGNPSSSSINKPYHLWKKRYPSGSDVNVYVNPKNPKEAVLEQISILTFILFIFCLLLGMGFSGMVLYSIKLTK